MKTKFTSTGSTNQVWGMMLFALLAGGLLLAGCGGGGIGGQEDPSIEVPDNLYFTQNSGGQALQIQNNGNGDLRIHNLELSNEVGEAFSEGGDGWPDELTVGPDESEELLVDYNPSDEVNYQGTITLEHNDTSIEDNTSTIDLETGGLGAEIFVDPSPVEFPQTPAGSEDWQVVEIRNIGEAALNIDDVDLTQGDSDFSISFFEDDGESGYPPVENDVDSPPVTELTEEDDVLYMRVTFSPEDEQPAEGEVQVSYNDGQQEIIDLSGNSGDTCLDVSAGEEMDFGPSSLNDLNYQTMTLRNCSPEAELTLFDLSISDDGGGVFSLDDSDLPGSLPDENEVLAPGETTTTLVGYTPDEETTHGGELLIESDDALEPDRTVELTGEGVDAECPTAEVGGAVGNTGYNNPVFAANQDIVDLSSDGSQDPDGTDLSYEWAVIDRPADSTASVEPDPHNPNPEFTIDVVGSFKIELTVTDEYGLTNCEPAILEIDASPTGEIYIQLTWEAPAVQEQHGGPDPEAGIGTDLDIHYVHQDGVWGDGQSVYYLNMSEDWGDDGTVNQDIDDLHGAEPENITHTDPNPGGAYRIGVHYYCDNGYGPSDATVQVYFGDTLYTEEQNRLESTDEFWYVGNAVWEPSDPYVNLLDQYNQQMPQLGNCF